MTGAPTNPRVAISITPPLTPERPSVTALGLRNERFHIRDVTGQQWLLEAEDLGKLTTLIALFGGEGWMRRNFPREQIVVAERTGGGRVVWVGIDVKSVAFWLAHLCVEAHQAPRPPSLPRGTHRISRWQRARSRLLGWLGWASSAIEGAF